MSRPWDIKRVASQGTGDVEDDLLPALLDERNEALGDVGWSHHVGLECLLEDVQVHIVGRVHTARSLKHTPRTNTHSH